MTTFYICRHGESENNKRHRLMGWIDTPLTDVGKLYAESAATKIAGIKFDRIISSDLGRAFVSAYVIARKLKYTIEIDLERGLREVNYGDFANKSYDEFPAIPSHKLSEFVFPNGESLSLMQKRVIDCVSSIGGKYEGKTVLLVAHDGTINAIEAAFKKISIGIQDATNHDHDFIAKFNWDAGAAKSFEEIT